MYLIISLDCGLRFNFTVVIYVSGNMICVRKIFIKLGYYFVPGGNFHVIIPF